MKKLSFIAASALLVIGVASCKKNSDVQNPESKEGLVKMVFSAVSNEGREKTSISGSDVLWSSGDVVKIYAGTETLGSDFTLTEGAGTTSATFEGWIAETATAPYYAVYPSSAAQGIDNSTIKYIIPANQAYVENSFATSTVPMVAYSEADKSLAFKNQTAFIKLQLTGAGTIETMTLESASNNICGTFNVSKTDPTASSTAVEGAKKITITNISGTALDGTTPKNVIIALAPANFASDDITLSITASDGGKFTTKIGDFNVGRSQGMAVDVEVEFETPAVRPVCQSALDADANWVQIGEQYWLKENTKCIEYDTESEAYMADWLTTPNTIPEETNAANIGTRPYYFNAISEEGDGYHYNWAAAVGLEDDPKRTTFSGRRQGICPNGSHLPSEDEWKALITFIEVTDSKGVGTAGKHLRSTTGWVPTTQGYLDTYNFTAKPLGYIATWGVQSRGEDADFQTSTKGTYDTNNCMALAMYYRYEKAEISETGTENGRSVRCLRD